MLLHPSKISCFKVKVCQSVKISQGNLLKTFSVFLPHVFSGFKCFSSINSRWPEINNKLTENTTHLLNPCYVCQSANEKLASVTILMARASFFRFSQFFTVFTFHCADRREVMARLIT